jgi:hypothetical protein
LGEFARGNTLLPSPWLEMMIVAPGVRELRLEVLQLLFAIIGKQPVERLLIVWPGEMCQ